MIKRAGIPLLVFILLVSNLVCQREAPGGDDGLGSRLFKKKDIKILITDSGLGGLSVVADLATRLPKSGLFRSARIVFFSSLFKERSGYNSLKNDADKARIFQVVLEAMGKEYAPDLLLIGCNTLSVVYHNTPFSKRPKFPVVGIVEAGAELIAGQFERSPEGTVVIFATRTTIDSGAHKEWLVEHGYQDVVIIDPNSRMADFLFSTPPLHRFSEARVSVEVVSKTRITEDMIASVGSVLEPLSPQTARALRRYRYDPGLFDVRLEGIEFID